MNTDIDSGYRTRSPESRRTKRAPDVWDSAAFSSIFLASSFSYISNIFPARPHAGNANRWKARQRANAKPSLNRKFRFSFVSKSKFVFMGWLFF